MIYLLIINVGYFIVGMVKQPTNEQTEFTMSSEDFPALPGTQNMEGSSNNALSNNIEGAEKLSGVGGGMSMAMDLQVEAGLMNEKAMKRGVQTSPDGNTTSYLFCSFTMFNFLL